MDCLANILGKLIESVAVSRLACQCSNKTTKSLSTENSERESSLCEFVRIMIIPKLSSDGGRLSMMKQYCLGYTIGVVYERDKKG